MLKNAEKLNDEFLENVVGGKVTAGELAGEFALGAVVGTTATMLTGCGLMLAGRIKAAKAKYAYDNDDDNKRCDKYLKQANKLNQIGMDMATLGFTKVLRHYEGEGKDFYERSDFYWR